jgi:hypothetical protein
MTRVILVGSLCVAAAALLMAQSGVGPIGNLQGRVDANNALIVASVATGVQGPPGPIANLRGKVDANNALVVSVTSGTMSPTTVQVGDGACGTTPTYAFTSDTTTGFYRFSAGTIGVCGAGTAGPTFTASQVNLPAGGVFRSSANGTNIAFPADGVIALQDNGATDGIRFQFNAAPTISSGFGASPSVVTNSTDTAGQVNVGTGGAATSGVILFNATWAVAPLCIAEDATNNIATRVTATTTTTMTLTAAAAWTASDIVTWHCIGHK